MEALLEGVQRFGKPEEVLTDQGRQYFTWRGKGEFQKLLDREGIQLTPECAISLCLPF
jgi:hypothetical protein